MSGWHPDLPEDDDMTGRAALYALDALDADERAEFEEALAHRPDLRAEVSGFQATAAALASITDEPAPASLRQAVLSEVDSTRQVAPVVDLAARRAARTRRVAWVAVAAAFVIVAGIVGYNLGDRRAPSTDGTSELAALMSEPDARLHELSGEAGVMKVVYSGNRDRAMLMGGGMEPLPEGKSLALWRQVGDHMVLAGMFEPDPDGSVQIALDLDLADTASLNVTLEPVGGSEGPTLPVLLSGPV